MAAEGGDELPTTFPIYMVKKGPIPPGRDLPPTKGLRPYRIPRNFVPCKIDPHPGADVLDRAMVGYVHMQEYFAVAQKDGDELDGLRKEVYTHQNQMEQMRGKMEKLRNKMAVVEQMEQMRGKMEKLRNKMAVVEDRRSAGMKKALMEANEAKVVYLMDAEDIDMVGNFIAEGYRGSVYADVLLTDAQRDKLSKLGGFLVDLKGEPR